MAEGTLLFLNLKKVYLKLEGQKISIWKTFLNDFFFIIGGSGWHDWCWTPSLEASSERGLWGPEEEGPPVCRLVEALWLDPELGQILCLYSWFYKVQLTSWSILWVASCPKYCEAIMLKVTGSCVSGIIYIDITCISVGTKVLHCGGPWVLYYCI